MRERLRAVRNVGVHPFERAVTSGNEYARRIRAVSESLHFLHLHVQMTGTLASVQG